MNLDQLKNQLLEAIKTSTLFFSADNHFGHNKMFDSYEPIRKSYTLSQKGESCQDFEKIMIKNWNLRLNPKSTMFHLGDFCINKRNDEQTEKNIKNNTRSVNGFKILIKGNHDKMELNFYLRNGWNFVVDKPIILLDENKIIENAPAFANCVILEHNGKRYMFSHFGVHQYDDRFEGKYKEAFQFLQKLYEEYNCVANIHGHSHSNGINSKKSFNCSVEAINFVPKTFGEILYSLNNH